MNKYEELAGRIIDDVCEIIENYYKVKPKCITDDDSIENPALINGTVYFDLECEIAEKIKALVNKPDWTCPECGEERIDDQRVLAGMKCGRCAYIGD